MLAQTQVQRVIPYYLRFLERFPDVAHLAAASREEVLLLWEGLGYYRRAHHLHEAARQIVERFRGYIPDTLEALQSLPGIGPYTASAVLGIGYNKPYLALDTNIRRILVRVFGDTGVSKLLPALVPSDARRLNEALMDFGATVCLARRPRCFCCPLQDQCVFLLKAGGKGDGSRKHRSPLGITVAVCIAGDSVLLRKSERKLFPGLWELPWKVDDGESLDVWVRALGEEYGFDVHQFAVCGAITHAYTKYRVTARTVAVRGNLITPSSRGVWVLREALSRYPLPSLFRKVLTLECLPNVSGFP